MFIKDRDMGGCYAHIHEQGRVSGILKLVPSIVGI